MYGDRPEPVEAATAFVAERFPEARVAFVGGSVLTEHRTPTSDLDVVVVLGEGVVAANGLVAPFRETSEHAGWVVEAFVHTRASIDHYIGQDVARRRPTMMRLCRDTVTLVDLEGAAEEIREAAEAALAAGPPPYDEAELQAVRYALTNLLDDMAGSEREDELVYLANAVVDQVAEIALVAGGRWSGGGKSLARELREAEPDLAERLVNGHRHVVVYGDTAVLHRAAVEVLLRVGGPLLAGYRVGGDQLPR
ncbi:MAG: hypothetical protein WBQ50_00195 [Nocardioides sp.]